MKLGLFMMPNHPPHRRHADTFDEDLDLLVLADQLGFEEAWIGEHTATTWREHPRSGSLDHRHGPGAHEEHQARHGRGAASRTTIR